MDLRNRSLFGKWMPTKQNLIYDHFDALMSKINIFLVFLDHFDALMSKMIF